MLGSAVPDNILDLIGNTPMVELKGFDTGPCRLFLKLENENPGGSIKDRIAVSMIDAAERSGELKPGGTIVEATAGNTGLGLALVAAAKGYRLILAIPDKMSTEKIAHLRAFGCDIRLTRSDVKADDPAYYMNMAARITAENPGYYHVNQFQNPANPLAHERTTGPEIWEQMDHEVDAVVCGVGSGGTVTGLSRFFARVSPKTELIAGRSAGVAAGRIHQQRAAGTERIVRGGRHRAELRTGDRRHFARDESVLHSRCGKLRHGAGFAAAIRNYGRRIGGLSGCGGAAVLPGAGYGKARGHVYLRYRKQVPIEDV